MCMTMTASECGSEPGWNSRVSSPASRMFSGPLMSAPSGGVLSGCGSVVGDAAGGRRRGADAEQVGLRDGPVDPVDQQPEADEGTGREQHDDRGQPGHESTLNLDHDALPLSS